MSHRRLPRIRPRWAAALLALAAAAVLAPGQAAQAITTAAPVNATPPVVSPSAPVVGQTVTATGDTWMNSPTSFAYQWFSCAPTCTAVATGPSYTPAVADLGHTLIVTESATNAVGTSAGVESGASAAVVDAAPVFVSGPSITGSAVEGQTLAEVHGMWTNFPAAFSLQWYDCDTAGTNCAAITGATGQTYVLGPGDVGHTIEVTEVAINVLGSAGPAGSAPTAVVTPPPVRPANTASPKISGKTVVGGTLACTTGTWTGTPPITYSYQWLGDANLISGATGSSYTVAPTDLAQAIACKVTATNAAGSTTATSSALVTTSAPACFQLAGTTLQKCRARATYDLARTRCSAISTKTRSGRLKKSVCVAKAKLTYKRALAVVKCQSITSAHKRAACVAAAKKIKK
ncbi:MAG: hypothetical protein ACR2KV_11850 [Solirubrobacteraceae bacterium]